MFSDAAELRTAILQTEPTEFISRYLFEPIPFIFENNLTLWIDWKSRLANELGVDPREMVLTGSAAVGYSLSPRKRLKRFSDMSDVDVGVISLHHFELAWRYLRQSRPEWLRLPPKTRTSLHSHRKNYIFSGTIATDLILPLLPFGRKWQVGLDAMGQLSPTRGRDVRLRIYRDFESLRSYQAHGLSKLRSEILEPTTDDEPIQVEE